MKVLCVCIGNSDRSPVMAGVLQMYLNNTGRTDVVCESAGVSDNAGKGGPAAQFAVKIAKRIGLDLGAHQKRQTTQINLGEYDLFICASDDIAAKVMEQGVPVQMIYNAQIPNPWPVHFLEDYEPTFALVLTAMYRVVARYFTTETNQ